MTENELRPYGKRSGESGVTGFSIGEDSIIVQFRNGDAYLYDGERPGAVHVARMTLHARAGRGLATYITKYVGSNYAKKVKV